MDLFLSRVLANHDNTPPEMRKALSYKEGVQLHQCCGAMLHFLREFQRIAPSADFEDARASLLSQFSFGFLDPDLQHSMESSVPPGDVSSVGAFRTDVMARNYKVRASLIDSSQVFEGQKRRDMDFSQIGLPRILVIWMPPREAVCLQSPECHQTPERGSRGSIGR